MAQVDIQIGGRRYELACRDGEEDHLRLIARMVDRKADAATQSMGGLNEARQLLLAALLLADELNDLSGRETDQASVRPSPAGPAPADIAAAAAIERLADRIESLADRLENRLQTA